MLGVSLSSSYTGFCTLGLRWTGYTRCTSGFWAQYFEGCADRKTISKALSSVPSNQWSFVRCEDLGCATKVCVGFSSLEVDPASIKAHQLPYCRLPICWTAHVPPSSAGALSWRKKLRNPIDEDTIGLFGKGWIKISGSKACFDMGHRNLQISRQCCGKGCCRISVDQYNIGLPFKEYSRILWWFAPLVWRSWLGRMRLRSWSGVISKCSKTWSSISLCWPVTQTLEKVHSLRAQPRSHLDSLVLFQRHKVFWVVSYASPSGTYRKCRAGFSV